VLKEKVGMLMEWESRREEEEEEEEEGGSAGMLTEEEWKKVKRVSKLLKGAGKGGGDRNEAVHKIMREGDEEEEDEGSMEEEEEEDDDEGMYEEEGGQGGVRGGRSPFAGVVAVADAIARQLANDCRAVAGGGMRGRKIKTEGQKGGGGGGGEGGGAGGRKRELIPVLTEEGKKRRKPLGWTDMELTRLLQGLQLFGHHRSLIWVKIKGFDARASKPVLGARSPLDVKDKARNIERSVRREMEMRGMTWPETWWNERAWAKLALNDHALFLSLQGGGR